MVSLKARLYVLVLKLVKRKQAMASAESLHATIKQRRQTSDYRPNPKVRRQLDIEKHDIGGFPAYVVKPKVQNPDNQTPDHYIFHLHGGAYTFELVQPHWHFVADMAQRLNAAIMMPVYPLAPEHDVLAALEYVHKAYAAFEDYAGGAPIQMMGDSAGAGMALAAVQQMVERDIKRPANMIMISPFVDVVLDNPAIPAIDEIDPWLAAPGLREAGRLYARDLEVTDPRVSPLRGSMKDLPPVHIFMGTRDILQPDAVALADKIKREGGTVSYREYAHMFHCWVIGTARESLQARDEIATIIRGGTSN